MHLGLRPMVHRRLLAVWPNLLLEEYLSQPQEWNLIIPVEQFLYRRHKQHHIRLLEENLGHQLE